MRFLGCVNVTNWRIHKPSSRVPLKLNFGFGSQKTGVHTAQEVFPWATDLSRLVKEQFPLPWEMLSEENREVTLP